MALVQWLSIIVSATSLIVVAVFLTLAGVCYGLAAIKHQQFANSNVVGGFNSDLPTEAAVRTIL